MSNLDNMINEILQDAELEAAKIVENAKKEIEGLVEKATDEAQRQALKIKDKAKIESSQIKDRIISNSNLVARDKILVAKQEVVDKVFEMAKERLANLDHEKYISYIEKVSKNMEINSDSEILLTKKEKEIAGNEFLGIKVSDETVESGFSLRNGKIILNNEFSTIIENLKDELELEISNNLFS